ncbi:hypothetical protein [Malikia granosa]|uniref:Uncharacterized protein n=1 Tax=Malikia granosa TaxID=263067 RepID=A0A2S9K734_9BURK|nr:hypothetical protein [Malikia granosa]PRD66227.1 hypothetical protein C6P64_05175 [Malikia granosa]
MTATPAKLLLLLACLPIAALAKLPTPELSPEEQAKAAETKAKAAHQAKVDGYQTCLASEKAAAHYFKTHPQAAKPAAAPACTDPGPFVAPAPAPAAASAAAAPAAPPAPAAKTSAKKP